LGDLFAGDVTGFGKVHRVRKRGRHGAADFEFKIGGFGSPVKRSEPQRRALAFAPQHDAFISQANEDKHDWNCLPVGPDPIPL